MTWERYDHHELHRQLCDRALSAGFRSRDEIGSQAWACPYYVPLGGKLGSDWGVIVSPRSTRFGLVTFEHDDCGCPRSDTEDEYGWCRHDGAPSQQGDTWWDGWVHDCDAWCDAQCGWAAM